MDWFAAAVALAAMLGLALIAVVERKRTAKARHTIEECDGSITPRPFTLAEAVVEYSRIIEASRLDAQRDEYASVKK